jgi:lysozyme family protein
MSVLKAALCFKANAMLNAKSSDMRSEYISTIAILDTKLLEMRCKYEPANQHKNAPYSTLLLMSMRCSLTYEDIPQ